MPRNSEKVFSFFMYCKWTHNKFKFSFLHTINSFVPTFILSFACVWSVSFDMAKYENEEISKQPYHPAAQDPRFELKLSRVGPGQYLDGRPPGKTGLLLEEVLVRPARGAHPVVCLGPNAPVILTGTLYCKKAPSFGWDVKPRSWLSVVIKNPSMSIEKE